MKHLLLISLLFISVSNFGQSSNSVIQVADIEIIPIDSISWTDLKNGFTRNDAICHCGYRLDSNYTYTLYSNDCTSSIPIDNGVWKIQNNNTLVLKSKEEVKIFQVVKVADARFFIPPNKLQLFKKDLTSTLTEHPSMTSTKSFSRRLVFWLVGKYFCGMVRLTGT
jgi:hypothetical protein